MKRARQRIQISRQMFHSVNNFANKRYGGATPAYPVPSDGSEFVKKGVGPANRRIDPKVVMG